MKELIESLVFVMPVVAGLFGLLQIYLLYLTFKLAANSITEFRSNQIWVENRKDAAQIINLLNLIEKEIESLKQFDEIDYRLIKGFGDLDDIFPELKKVIYLFLKYKDSRDRILNISSEIDSLEYKINKRSSSFFYRSFATLLMSLQMSDELVHEYTMADLQKYQKYYDENLQSNFENTMRIALEEFLSVIKEKRNYYINYLQKP